MIASVKKSVNHSKTVTSMREMQKIDSCHFVRGDATVENAVVFCLFTVSMFLCGSTKFEHYD